MSQPNFLWRNGQKIEVAKEPEFITATLPDKGALQEVNQIKEVQEVKQVFHNMFKVRTSVYERDGLIEQLHSRERFKGAMINYAYNPQGDLNTRYYLTDKMVVGFEKGTYTSVIEDILNLHGLQFLKSYPTFENTYLLRMIGGPNRDPLTISNDLMERKEVIFAEPNLISRFASSHTPPDTLFPNQWHLNAQDGIELVAAADVKAVEAWEFTRGSRDVVVAVIDDGFDISHPDLTGPGKLIDPKDFVDFDNAPFPTRDHGDFHGTPCAGVAIGEENGQGIVGIAPRCAFLPIRFDLAADDNMLFEIFDYAGKRADVISNSWGPVPVFAPLSTLLSNQLSELTKTGGPRGKGCVILFAAGNYNAPLQDFGNNGFVWRHPNRGLIETKGAIVNGHGAHPDVITVAASTSQNRKSAYSNWGGEISICAPSDNWHPLDPQTRLPGRGIWTTDNENSGFGFEPGSRYTSQFGGTSSATPLAAGVAALIISANPDLTAKQVREILETTADKIVDNTPDPVLGLSKGNYNTDGHSEWFGFGKVNALEAVKKAIAMRPGGEDEPQPPTPPDTDSITEGVFIVAAQVDPEGSDIGKEEVLILNVRNEEVSMEGWSISDSRNRTDVISGAVLKTGEVGRLTLTEARLLNTGGVITLRNDQNQVVDEVAYERSDIPDSGWLVKF